MRHVCRTLFLCCVCLLAGCVTTFSSEPLGEAVAVLNPEQWNGVWMDQNGKLFRWLVIDAADGKLVSIEDWKDCNTRTTASGADGVMQLRQSGSWYFQSPAKKAVLYDIWLAFRRDREALFVCSVDEERVRELVASGALPGFTYEEDVVVWPLSHNQYRELLSDDRPAFRCGPPIGEVFMRLPAELDPCRTTDRGESR